MIIPVSAQDRSRTFSSSVSCRTLALSLVLFALPLVFAARAHDTFQSRPETRRFEPVAAGVEHIEVRRGDFGRGIGPDRWTVNVLVLDPSKTKLSLGRALDRGVGTETPSSITAAARWPRRTEAASGRRESTGESPRASWPWPARSSASRPTSAPAWPFRTPAKEPGWPSSTSTSGPRSSRPRAPGGASTASTGRVLTMSLSSILPSSTVQR